MAAEPKKARQAKQPNRPNVNRRPVSVKSYYKKGKLVRGYKRRMAGDAEIDKI